MFIIPDPAPVAVSRPLNQSRHQPPVLGLVPGYIHTTLHLALALLHVMSYIPLVLTQAYLHCLYYLHTFIFFSGQGHNNKAAGEPATIVLHSKNLTANVFYLGMRHEDTWVDVKPASSRPRLELILCLLTLYSICKTRRATMGMLLAICLMSNNRKSFRRWIEAS